MMMMMIGNWSLIESNDRKWTWFAVFWSISSKKGKGGKEWGWSAWPDWNDQNALRNKYWENNEIEQINDDEDDRSTNLN